MQYWQETHPARGIEIPWLKSTCHHSCSHIQSWLWGLVITMVTRAKHACLEHSSTKLKSRVNGRHTKCQIFVSNHSESTASNHVRKFLLQIKDKIFLITSTDLQSDISAFGVYFFFQYLKRQPTKFKICSPENHLNNTWVDAYKHMYKAVTHSMPIPPPRNFFFFFWHCKPCSKLFFLNSNLSSDFVREDTEQHTHWSNCSTVSARRIFFYLGLILWRGTVHSHTWPGICLVLSICRISDLCLSPSGWHSLTMTPGQATVLFSPADYW